MSIDSQNRRGHKREPLRIDLSKVLFTTGKERRAVRCLGVDVSRLGIGIVGFEELPVRTELTLAVNGKGIALEVVWSRADSVRSDVFHAGLQAKTPVYDLLAELHAAGLITVVGGVIYPPFGREDA